jgi:hypothetical protein
LICLIPPKPSIGFKTRWANQKAKEEVAEKKRLTKDEEENEAF